jgi:hypothetical protein
MGERKSTHLPPRTDLPVPRLELVWERTEDSDDGPHVYNAIWYHRLVLRHYTGHLYALDLSTTRCVSHDDDTPATQRGRWPADPDAQIMTPFRAGTDIRWDARHLNIPAFAIVGDVIEQQRPLPQLNYDREMAKPYPQPRSAGEDDEEDAK